MMIFAILATTAFCKIATPTTLTYAPDYLAPLMRPPTAADYLERGWLYNRVQPPSPPEGYIVSNKTYEARGEAVYAVYGYAPAPTPVTRYSKLKIYGAIAQLGKWAEVEAWLRAKNINGVNGWMAFELAQEIADDHPLFAPLAAEAKALLGLTDEAFAALLAQCILEG